MWRSSGNRIAGSRITSLLTASEYFTSVRKRTGVTGKAGVGQLKQAANSVLDFRSPGRTTILLALFGLASLGARPAFALDDVTVALAIPPTVTDGGIWSLGDELGIWRDAGLAVKTLTFEGAGALVPQVASGHATIGLPVVDPILAAYADGRAGLPVQYFYNATPVYTMEFAVPENSPIKTLADLKGRKIGVGALTWGTIPTTRAVLHEAGLATGAYQIVPVGVLGSGFRALTSGQIDALNYNSSWHDMLEQTGTPIRRIVFPAPFSEMAGNGFIANSRQLAANPDLYARFGRAYTEAQYACGINPRACVESFWRQHPEAKPKQGDPDKNLSAAVELVKRRLARVTVLPDGKPRTPGAFDFPVIQQYISHMREDGQFGAHPVPVADLFSNALVPKFSAFDHDAIAAAARKAQ